MRTVDFNNKGVKQHIADSLLLPKTHPRSPWVTIPNDQFYLYRLSYAYEVEMEPIESDHVYDMFTRYLQRQEIMFPEVWDAASLTCFRDGSWQHTGMFIHGHDPEDEEWLL